MRIQLKNVDQLKMNYKKIKIDFSSLENWGKRVW